MSTKWVTLEKIKKLKGNFERNDIRIPLKAYDGVNETEPTGIKLNKIPKGEGLQEVRINEPTTNYKAVIVEKSNSPAQIHQIPKGFISIDKLESNLCCMKKKQYENEIQKLILYKSIYDKIKTDILMELRIIENDKLNYHQKSIDKIRELLGD